MGSTVKSFLDVSSLSAQAMLQGTIIVLKCKFSYSQLLGTGFASFCTGVEHWEHLGPSPRGDGPGPCPGRREGKKVLPPGEGNAAGGGNTEPENPLGLGETLELIPANSLPRQGHCGR